ncbi:hypothetical protein EDD15DRAFT_2410728 [Pisolithus albus]|nr:hypothetical protein EDD15DRAFT_2410728 [Pisolithus albus]
MRHVPFLVLTQIKDPRLVDLTYDFWITQDSASDFITNHVNTAPPLYTSPRLPHVAERPSGYPWESGDIPTFGDLDNSFAARTMGPIPSLYDYPADQGTGPYEPWPRLSNSAAPPPQEPHPSDDFVIGNVPLPPHQGPFFNIPHPTDPLHAFQYVPGYQSLTPPQSNSVSHSTSHGYDGFYPPFPMINRNSPSWILQDRLGYFSPVQPHYARRVHPPGFHGGVGIVGGRYGGDSYRELSHHDTIQYTRHMYTQAPTQPSLFV